MATDRPFDKANTRAARFLAALADPGGLRAKQRRAETAVLARVGVLTLLHCLYFFNQACDDAYISLAYAERWVDGRGLTLNDVRPSEGYSNLLWVLIAAGGMLLGLDGLAVVKVVGLVCGIGVALVGVRTVRAAGGRIARQLAAGLFIAGATPIAAWSVTGLETALYALEIITLTLLGMRLEFRWARWLFAVAAGAITITRPEGMVVVAGLCVALYLFGRRSRPRARGLGLGLLSAGLIVTAHQMMRVAYFGKWFGNSAVHKWHPMGVPTFVGVGLDQLQELTVLYWATPTALLWLVAFLPLLRRRSRRRILPVALVLTATAGFHLLVGGDLGPYFRFLAPAMAPAGVMIACIGLGWRRGTIPGRIVRPIGPMLAVVLGVSGAVSMLQWIPLPHHFYACPSWVRPTAHAEVVAWLDEHADPIDRILLSEMGLIPHRTGLPCFDYLGLCDRFMYERGTEFHPERYDEHEPSFIVFGWLVFPDGQVSARLPAENAILAQPDFQAKFRPVAEFPIQEDRSLMEYGYYRKRTDEAELRFLVFQRREDR